MWGQLSGYISDRHGRKRIAARGGIPMRSFAQDAGPCRTALRSDTAHGRSKQQPKRHAVPEGHAQADSS